MGERVQRLEDLDHRVEISGRRLAEKLELLEQHRRMMEEEHVRADNW